MATKNGTVKLYAKPFLIVEVQADVEDDDQSPQLLVMEQTKHNAPHLTYTEGETVTCTLADDGKTVISATKP